MNYFRYVDSYSALSKWSQLNGESNIDVLTFQTSKLIVIFRNQAVTKLESESTGSFFSVRTAWRAAVLRAALRLSPRIGTLRTRSKETK